MQSQAVAGGVLAHSVSLAIDLSGVVLPPWPAGASPACLADPDLFFPEGYNEFVHGEQITAARTACLGCDLRPLCLEWAVPQTDLDGIWAATTPPERRRIRVGRRRRAA